MPGRITIACLLLGMAHPLLGAEPSSRAAALSMAAQIDKLVEAGYQEHKVQPNPRASDEVFARRVYLDILGRIPTRRELTDFLDSPENDKRYDLIDKLLDTEGYVSHLYNFWADLLRIKTRLTNQVNGTPYTEWVKRAIRENMPYDKFVHELLTAEGRITDNGATGYYIRDSGMPLDNLANTVRIFLGTRIGCAQCHDHPFDKWTQHEYYELAAYTYGVNTRQRPPGTLYFKKMVKDGQLSRIEEQLLKNLVRAESYAVHDTPKKLRLPDDYKYKDAKPKDEVQPHVIFGQAPTPSPGQTPRQTFAQWLTSRQNPRFTVNIANRLWKRALGRGVVEPVDDFTDDTQAANPHLLEFLTEQMKSLNYDVRAYLRGIYYSKTYQRQSTTSDVDPTKPYDFQGPLLRRMTAQQVWDSLMTLIVPDLDGRQAMTRAGKKIPSIEYDISKMTPEQVIAKVKEIAAGSRGNVRRQIMMELERNQPEKYRGLPITYVRASEWVSPADPGSLIEQFGASDRELIDSAHTDPTITQALELLNGRITNGLVDKRYVLGQQVLSAKTPQEQTQALFLSILGRSPHKAEADAAISEIRANASTGLRNVATALVNTREFIFVQ